jgi:hypothetical protein
MAIRIIFSAVPVRISKSLALPAKSTEPSETVLDHPRFRKDSPSVFDFDGNVQDESECLVDEFHGCPGITRLSFLLSFPVKWVSFCPFTFVQCFSLKWVSFCPSFCPFCFCPFCPRLLFVPFVPREEWGLFCRGPAPPVRGPMARVYGHGTWIVTKSINQSRKTA